MFRTKRVALGVSCVEKAESSMYIVLFNTYHYVNLFIDLLMCLQPTRRDLQALTFIKYYSHFVVRYI